MLKALEDLIYYLIENWRSLTVQGALTAVVLIAVKRIGIQQLKKLLHLKDNAEMTRIEAKVDLLMKERGIEWSSPPNGSKRVGIPRITSYLPCSRTGIQSANQLRRMKNMREYLKKLGRTKFQAFIITTITNVALIIGYVLNVSDVQEMVGAWAPLVLAGSQLLAGAIYTWVEGAKDTAVVELETAKVEAKTIVEVRSNEAAATNEPNEFADNRSNR